MKSGEILLRLLINYGSLIQVPGQRPNRILIKFTFLQSLGPKDSAHTIFKSGNYLYTVTRALAADQDDCNWVMAREEKEERTPALIRPLTEGSRG